MYSIVVTAGPSLDESTQSIVHVNSPTYVPISNEHFEGQLTVRVKDFNGLAPDGQEPIAQSSYFDTAKDATFSIEASGIYKTGEEGISADDLMFGIVFRKSIVDRLPSTYPLVVKALQWFNPNIEFQLQGDAPTVLAPLFAIMSRVTCTPDTSSFSDSSSLTKQVVNVTHEDTTMLLNAQKHGSRAAGALPSDEDLLRSMLPSTSEFAKHEPVKGWFGTYPAMTSSEARHKWFSDQAVRKETIVKDSEYVLTADIQNGFMDFRDMSLRMSGLPITVPLGPFMKGRPVQYCCISRDRKKLFWCVVFTIVEGPEEDGTGPATT